MTALAVRQINDFDQVKVNLSSVLDQISRLSTVPDVQEARARVEAMKAWAKAHKRLKDVRLDLLRIEMYALVRVVELGGADSLPPAEREAAEWLHAKSPAEREQFLTESGSATTVAGMCRSVWMREENDRLRHQLRQRGRRDAVEPTPPPEDMDQALRDRRHQVVGVAAALANLVEDYASNGTEPFTVDEVTEALIEDASIDRYGDEPTLRGGVREVVREAISRAPVLTLGDTILPATITARNEDGVFIRVPASVATVAHLDDCIALREEQLRQDAAALDRLRTARTRLGEVPGCTRESRIGALVARSIKHT